MPHVEVLDDPRVVSARLAELLGDWTRQVLEGRDRVVLGFSGGSTPGPALERFGQAALPWERVHVTQVDERVAPDDHADRNWTILTERLFAGAAVPDPARHPMPVTADDLDAAADRYAATLAELAGTPPVLDVIHLGLGDDGHTASLTPGDAVLEVLDRDVAVTGEYQGRRRMTLTYPAINRARRIVWQVVGASKAGALRAALRDDSVPASGIRREPDVTVLADRAAAALL